MDSPASQDAAGVPGVAAITMGTTANGKKFGIAMSQGRARDNMQDPVVGDMLLFEVLDGEHIPVVESILVRHGPSKLILPKELPAGACRV